MFSFVDPPFLRSLEDVEPQTVSGIATTKNRKTYLSDDSHTRVLESDEEKHLEKIEKVLFSPYRVHSVPMASPEEYKLAHSEGVYTEKGPYLRGRRQCG